MEDEEVEIHIDEVDCLFPPPCWIGRGSERPSVAEQHAFETYAVSPLRQHPQLNKQHRHRHRAEAAGDRADGGRDPRGRLEVHVPRHILILGVPGLIRQDREAFAAGGLCESLVEADECIALRGLVTPDQRRRQLERIGGA